MSLDLDDTSHTDNLSIFADEESKIPIHWDKNVASISGTLLSVGRALRTQHPELHHLIVTNTVEERGKVPFVRTMHNVADFFTKAFEAKKFHAMRRIVMNDPERL